MAHVRVCAIGTGRAGMVHARNVRWHLPHTELVAVVDAAATSAAAAAAELDLAGRSFGRLAEATDVGDIDAVVVTTPTFTHEALVTDAAARGIHVLCEKPMALTVASCDAMVDACARAHVILQLAFMRRCDAPFVGVERDLDVDVVGAPLIVRSLTRCPGLPPAWANDVTTSNGMLAEVNCHDFDTVRWLGGAEIVEVHARAAARNRPDLLATLPHFYDTAVVSATLANGVFGAQAAKDLPVPHRHRPELGGDHEPRPVERPHRLDVTEGVAEQLREESGLRGRRARAELDRLEEVATSPRSARSRSSCASNCRRTTGTGRAAGAAAWSSLGTLTDGGSPGRSGGDAAGALVHGRRPHRRAWLGVVTRNVARPARGETERSSILSTFASPHEEVPTWRRRCRVPEPPSGRKR
jgi:predicted dehydrogenase